MRGFFVIAMRPGAAIVLGKYRGESNEDDNSAILWQLTWADHTSHLVCHTEKGKEAHRGTLIPMLHSP